MRRPFVAGNWKMNLDLVSADALVRELSRTVGASPRIDIAVCPPTVYLLPVRKLLDDSSIRVGAQNCWSEPKGAFTGEISPAMLKETGCRYVILGHSERRHAIGPKGPDGRPQGETDAMVAAKVRAVLGVGLVPILCVGETLAERDLDRTEIVLSGQVAGSLAGVERLRPEQIVIAYEPVWAIGTGRTATPEQAQEAHRHVRGRLDERFGSHLARGVRILYGGSVTSKNAEELMRCPDVDGALVGGASLRPDDFLGVIRGCEKAKLGI
jgi:triosephosphate isomerase